MGQLLDEIVKNVNKRYKEEIITKGLSDFNYERIPFTSPRMNYCTFGGIPMGKLTEFYGEEHGGKTTTALDIVSNYQNLKGAKDVLYIDAENTLDTEWAFKLGVDVESMYILQPKAQSAEEIFDIVCESVETGEIGLWVLDSIGMLMSGQELEKSIEDKTYAGISQALTKFTKRITGIMSRTNCTGIGINQIRDNLNSTWGGYTTPGGKAWKHGCAVRLEFRRGKFIDEKGNELTRSADSPAGNIVEMVMVKNKTCPPTRKNGRYTLNYEDGVDYMKDLVDVAIRYDLIQKHGAWFDIVDTETGEIIEGKIQGQSNVFELLSQDDDLLEWLETSVENAMMED